MNEIFKYLPYLLKYAKYLKFVPLVIQLVTAIHEAERTFSSAKSGTEKRVWVTAQLDQMIGMLEGSNVIGPRFATALRDGAEAIVTVWVEGWKDADGADALLPHTDQDGTARIS